MFSRQTITKDPVSVTPSVFDIIVLLGWFSYPVAINVTGNEAVLDSTPWHVLQSISLDASNPELLLIPWVAEATGVLDGNLADLTDSLLLGDIEININLVVDSLYTGGSDLAPSWYIRQPFKNVKSFPFNTMDLFDPKVLCPHIDATKKERIIDIPWGELEDISKVLSGDWNFLTKIDEEISSLFIDFADRFSLDISQKYSYPDTKDTEKIIPWGKFDDHFNSTYSCGYYYPAVKDHFKIIPWNQFTDQFNLDMGLDFLSPPPLDVFKTIFTGPNWFPKWCIHQYETTLGGVIFNFLTDINQPYQQYFPQIEYGLNPQPDNGTLPIQLSILPDAAHRRSMYPGGSMFSGSDIGYGSTSVKFRGGTGGRLNVKTGFLDFPIYMNNSAELYDQVCYDGYRLGPKDSTEKVPYFKVVIPDIRSYYLIMNTVSMKLVSDNTIIPISNLTVSTDIDSWCWSLSAELRRKVDLDLITPTGSTPVEVEVIVNGNTWRFIIENFGENRQFGKTTYQISGRTPSASLAAPYSPPTSLKESSIIQAAQLADQAVANTGYTINWLLTDWLIPADVYSVSDVTPMQQLIKIATAAGGVVHSDKSTTTISLLPRYAVVPWSWGGTTVDAALPTYTSKTSRYEPKYQYNGAYVSGESQGVTCLIKRTGTDGAEQPQMQVDSLVTATEAGLQLGTKILADSGNRSLETLEAPLFDNPGLLTPGMLISVTDKWETWKGQVVSVQINAQRPVVNQSLGVLRYHGT